MRIEFCGGIGCGKTTLAQRLAGALSFQLIRENYNDVPYWKDFCRDYVTYEFEKNVGFLLAYGNLLRSARSGDRIFDFSFAQALAFVTISNDRKAEYPLRTIVDHLLDREGRPDIIIRVTCEGTEQIKRIKCRGRDTEKGIDVAYLEKLDAGLDKVVEPFCSTNGIKLVNYPSGSLSQMESSDPEKEAFDDLITTIRNHNINSAL